MFPLFVAILNVITKKAEKTAEKPMKIAVDKMLKHSNKGVKPQSGSGFWDDLWIRFQVLFKTIGDFADKTVGAAPRGVLGGCITPFELGYATGYNAIRKGGSGIVPSKSKKLQTGSGFWDDFWIRFQIHFKAIRNLTDKTLGVISRKVLGGNVDKNLEKVAFKTVGEFAKGFIKGSKATGKKPFIFNN